MKRFVGGAVDDIRVAITEAQSPVHEGVLRDHVLVSMMQLMVKIDGEWRQWYASVVLDPEADPQTVTREFAKAAASLSEVLKRERGDTT